MGTWVVKSPVILKDTSNSKLRRQPAEGTHLVGRDGAGAASPGQQQGRRGGSLIPVKPCPQFAGKGHFCARTPAFSGIQRT